MKHFSKTHGWMDIIDVMQLANNAKVLTCKTWNNQLVFVGIPDPSSPQKY